VVIHVVRNSRAARVVTETMAGHRPSIWVSDLYGAQQGHADLWQVCLAHQLRDCQYAIEAGDTIFAPRMKALLLRAVVLARRRKSLAESTRRSYLQRLDRALNAIMVLAPTNSHGRRLREGYGKLRSHLFTFLEHPDAPPGRVDDWRGGGRSRGELFSGGFHPAGALSIRTVAPFPVAARQTGHADFPHPAFSRPVRSSLSAGRPVALGR
jgi:hypothetical protein